MTLSPEQMTRLVRQAQRGERAAFDHLASALRPRLLRLGRQWLREPALAEELAQETLLQGYRRLGSLREPGAFLGWLTAIARNWALQRLRAGRGAEELALCEELVPLAPDPAPDLALQWDLQTALRRLPPSQRLVGELCLVRQHSLAEAAALLHTTPEVIKGRLQRARSALREELRELMPATKTPQAPLILVIDDEPHIARLIQVNLEVTGYRVMTAGDGEAGLAAARKHHPDLVILDLMMPRKHGWDVLRELRSARKTLLTPVLVISAFPPEEPRNAICHELADAYWQKPFSPLVLQAWVDRRLGRISARHAGQLTAWRQVRFGEAVTPQQVVAYLSGEQYALVRVEARTLLGELGAEAIPALAEALHSPDEGMWYAAALLLARRDEPAAVEALLPLLTHEQQQRRWEALAALGQMRNEQALLALAEQARPVFEEVVAALGAPSGPSAEGVLRRVHTPEAAVALRDHQRGQWPDRRVQATKVAEDGSVSCVSSPRATTE